MQETLNLIFYPKVGNRGVTGEFEIACDQPEELDGLSHNAFYDMYDDLANAVLRQGRLCSPGVSALRNEEIIEAVLFSNDQQGRIVQLDALG